MPHAFGASVHGCGRHAAIESAYNVSVVVGDILRHAGTQIVKNTPRD